VLFSEYSPVAFAGFALNISLPLVVRLAHSGLLPQIAWWQADYLFAAQVTLRAGCQQPCGKLNVRRPQVSDELAAKRWNLAWRQNESFRTTS